MTRRPSPQSMRFGTSMAVLLLWLVAAIMASLALGSKTLPLAEVVAYWFNQAGDYPTRVMDNRLPRTLAALLCGSALGLSGALMQGLTRNPLADTGLLGINAGAAAAIVSLALLPQWHIAPVWLAIPGALLSALLVCAIGLGDRQAHYTRLILAGAAIAASLHAYVQAVAQLHPHMFDQYRFWAGGSLSGLSLPPIRQMLPLGLTAGIAGLWLGRYMNIMALGDQAARALGANVRVIQGMVLLSASVLAAVAVALAGPVAFIGLGSAHLARRLVGHDYRILLPASLLVGGCLLLCADILAQLVLAPEEVATGIMTALLGAPMLYLMIILRTQRRL